MILIEDKHYPLLRSMTIDELCRKYNAAQKQYWTSAKLWKKYQCNEAGMTVYAEYMTALWGEIERRICDDLGTELLELIYTRLMK